MQGKLFQMSLSLYLACFFLLSSASAQSTSSQNSSDDWTFKNPPEAVHIHDQFQPYVSVDIDSKALTDNLPHNSSAMTKLLNQYEVVHIQPNLNKLEWTPEIDKNLRRTDNILAELNSYAERQKKPTRLEKTSGTVKNIATGIVAAPIILVGMVVLSPILIPLFREDHEAKASGKTAREEQLVKEREAQEAKLQKILRKNFQQTESLKAAIESLVKESKEDLISTNDLNLRPVHNNHYNILPSRNDYSVDLSRKTLIYQTQQKHISIPIYFKTPYPRQEDVIENFNKSSLKFLPDSKISFKVTGNVRYLPEGFHEHIEITKCSIGYTDNYAHKGVFCNGVRTWR
jgi:hypothetical protein